MSGNAHITKHICYIIFTDINILNILGLYFLLIRYKQTNKHLHNICLYRDTDIVYDIVNTIDLNMSHVLYSELREHNMFYLCTSTIGLILSFNKIIQS